MKEKKLGLVGLTAVVVGAMIGAGIFNIAQNMASGSGAGGVLVAWGITGVGMLCLVLTFKKLSDRFPHLNRGIYEYAARGFGRYAGFNVAWGYWLCVAFGNIAYAVMLNDALGAFFPRLLDHSWPTVVFGTLLVWGMFFLVRSGLKTASAVNVSITVLKFAALFMVVVVLVFYFKTGLFKNGFWGGPDGASVGLQVKDTMMVTIWCFLGIEGAVGLASKAKKGRDVGKAGIIGFILAWTVYALVSCLCFGIMGRAEMENLDNPSVAGMMRSVCGDWAYWFVLVSIIISLAGGWLAWTLVVAQTPYGAAEDRLLPRQFKRLSKRGVPLYGLGASSVFMTLFMVVVCTAGNVYMAAISLTSVMVLPAYLTSAMFLVKTEFNAKPVAGNRRCGRCNGLLLGTITVLYCLWLFYAAGLLLFLASSLFYLMGVPFYVAARRQYADVKGFETEPVFTGKEKWLVGILGVCGLVTLVLVSTGNLAL